MMAEDREDMKQGSTHAHNNNEAEIQQSRDKEQSDDSEMTLNKDLTPSSPEPHPVVAVDMTGAVKSPTSGFSMRKKRTSKTSLKRDEDESLLKQRLEYSNGDEDESERSSMEFSRQSLNSIYDNTTSAELTIQQIHDQRSKLSAKAKTLVTAEQAARPPAPITHQVSSDLKPPRLQSSNLPMNPGAYSIESPETASARNMDDGSGLGSSIMQLEAVPVDETFEQAKMQEMEEQINREIEKRLSLERKITKGESGHNRSCSKERMPIIMALLIVLAGMSTGLYFLLAPTSPGNSLRKMEPNANFIYPAPTAEECDAVLNGAAVPNQDSYPPLMVDLTIDVSLNTAWEDSVDAALLGVRDILQSQVVPTLVGCNEKGQEYFNRTFSDDRYMVMNADVMNLTKSESDCNPEEPRPCVRVVVQHSVWLRGEANVLDLMSFVNVNFGPKLLQDVGGGEIMQQAKFVAIGPSSVDLLYPPPTDEECEAVINGFEVPNQDQYSTLMFDATFDVSTNDTWFRSTDALLLEVQEQVISSAVPTMMGCTTIGQGILNSTDYTNTKYVLANVNIVHVTKSASDCSAGQPQPCVQVVVRFLTWLKGEAELFDLISLVHNDFRDLFHENITQSDMIEKFMLVSVTPAPDDALPPELDVGENVDFLFPPPSEERCEAVFNGTAVANQDNYFNIFADAILDVSTHVPWEDSLDEVLQEVGNQFQSIIVPALVGCLDTVLLNRTFTADRYIMVNSVVLNTTRSPLECNIKETRPCVRAVVHLRSWLMKEVSILEMIIHTDQNFGPSLIGMMGSKTDKDSIIKQAKIVSLSLPSGV